MTPFEVRNCALALPGTTEEPQLSCSFFRVRDRLFATIPPSRRYLHVFLAAADSEYACAIHPDVVERLVWDDHVVGVRIDLHGAAPRIVERLISQAWARDSGKHLLDGCAIRVSGNHRRIVV